MTLNNNYNNNINNTGLTTTKTTTNALFSNDVGTWTAGIPSPFNFVSEEMQDKVALLNGRKVYKVVAVMQPPFISWNETLSMNIIHFEPFRSDQFF